MLRPEPYKVVHAVCVCVCVCHKFRDEKDQRILNICDGSGNGSGIELGHAESPFLDLELQILASFVALASSSFLFFSLFQRLQ